MLLERVELDQPELLDPLEPLVELPERIRTQAIDSLARVVLARRLDEPARTQHPEMLAHRRLARAEPVREIARAARLFAQQLDDASSRRIGERRERRIQTQAETLSRSRCM